MTTSTQAYGEPWYWDNRYSNEPGPFDWYQKYLTLAPITNLYVPPAQPVLVVGCGNSGTFFFTPFIPIFFFFLFLIFFSSDLVKGYLPFCLDWVKIRFLCFGGCWFVGFWIQKKIILILVCLQRSAKAWWLMAVTRMLSTLIYLRWSLKLWKPNTKIAPNWNVSFLLCDLAVPIFHAMEL